MAKYVPLNAESVYEMAQRRVDLAAEVSQMSVLLSNAMAGFDARLVALEAMTLPPEPEDGDVVGTYWMDRALRAETQCRALSQRLSAAGIHIVHDLSPESHI